MVVISISDAFRQTMEELRVKGSALAAASGCSPGHISQFKNGGGEVTLTMLSKLLDAGETCAPGFKACFATHWLGSEVKAIEMTAQGISEVDVALTILQNVDLTDDQIAKGLMILSTQLRKTVKQSPVKTPALVA